MPQRLNDGNGLGSKDPGEWRLSGDGEGVHLSKCDTGISVTRSDIIGYDHDDSSDELSGRVMRLMAVMAIRGPFEDEHVRIV